ncbi:MAG: hypothetical protein KKA62_00555 [Nanoarchaeota archaeon]|nr:hypothetical protein [Nanoarchaeota archaeon]MBU1644389.1 hypothetical protein [Nanoarchaeota archaeon]MBU1976424.1 hypothetical protein [Nanoarchaeota archaeon]
MVEDIGIESFLEETSVTKVVQPALAAILFPFLGENPRSYFKQMPSASRNVEIVVENLLKLSSKPKKLFTILKPVCKMTTNYGKAQKETKIKEQHLVYTDLDHRIPFRPTDDILYVYQLAHMALFSRELVENYPNHVFKEVIKCFLDVEKEAVEVFQKYPTVMPRFTDHDRITLKATQAFDNPLNCCPSLHIAYSLLIYNISKVLGFDKWDKELWKSFEQAAELTIRPVLYTKQHALIDVAFGMQVAKKSFEKIFSFKFEDLTAAFSDFEKRDQDIPYRAIEAIYYNLDDPCKKENSLADVVEQFLKVNKFPVIKPKENNAYFDIRSGKVVKLF